MEKFLLQPGGGGWERKNQEVEVALGAGLPSHCHGSLISDVDVHHDFKNHVVLSREGGQGSRVYAQATRPPEASPMLTGAPNKVRGRSA
jgi:flavin-dependent dehydrogenase